VVRILHLPSPVRLSKLSLFQLKKIPPSRNQPRKNQPRSFQPNKSINPGCEVIILMSAAKRKLISHLKFGGPKIVQPQIDQPQIVGIHSGTSVTKVQPTTLPG
jgi:hypothetical protein